MEPTQNPPRYTAAPLPGITADQANAMIAYAEAEGAAAGRNAAGWWEQDAIGGRAPASATLATALASLEGLRDGDPAVLDELPAPNLSGEWADDLTADQLAVDAAGNAGVDPDDVDLRGDAGAAWAELVGACAEEYEGAYIGACQEEVELACLRVIEAAAADARERGDEAEARRLRRACLPEADDEGDPYPGWGMADRVDAERPDAYCCAIHDPGDCLGPEGGCRFAYPCDDEQAEQDAYEARNPTTLFAVESRWRAVIDWAGHEVTLYRPDGVEAACYGLPRVGPGTEAEAAAELAAAAESYEAAGPHAEGLYGPLAAAAAGEGSTPTPDAGGPHAPAQAADEAGQAEVGAAEWFRAAEAGASPEPVNAYRAAATTARAAAAEAALHAADWLGNGGPAGYDLPEACHHLEAALASARLALQYDRLADRYHDPKAR